MSSGSQTYFLEVGKASILILKTCPPLVLCSPVLPHIQMILKGSSDACHVFPPKSTPSRWSSVLLFSISEKASSFVLPTWGYESTRGLNGGSSDDLSIPPFSELMMTRKERWSFDGENFGFSWDKITRFVGRNLGSPFNLQSCVCAKLLTERSSLDIQKVIATNELVVVAVLTCGHAYMLNAWNNDT
ncbi:uncharacterized protein LOC111371086 [Olea europaea var. sylvestris]|uniref:uncharacterized protein LOC111371086 n=1 Tax=Olea europaea var. sylvestris TaxID=158386 RepID=UPI000C1D75B8|nr:uncharacterized protein LOC111371086 [Olea europaea var. sylvestris]